MSTPIRDFFLSSTLGLSSRRLYRFLSFAAALSLDFMISIRR